MNQLTLSIRAPPLLGVCQMVHFRPINQKTKKGDTGARWVNPQTDKTRRFDMRVMVCK